MHNRVQLFFGNRPYEIDCTKYAPDTTVLQWLRSLRGQSGTKEGCGEGDCGACTVVLGEVEHGRIRYKSVTSCLLFLPALQGKWLITVEHLQSNDGTYHPIQQALAGRHGIQCGFCTPGVSMSMLALYKNQVTPDRDSIIRALSGNLCRCTGYAPFISACRDACTGAPDHFTALEQTVLQHLNHITGEAFEYNTSGLHYFRPTALSTALKWKAAHPGALLINGSTEVAVKKNKRQAHFPLILDLGAIPALKEIIVKEEQLIIGAGVCMEELRKATAALLPELSELLEHFASLQVRNIASIGGNIASASPIGDTIPALMAYGATVQLSGSKGLRNEPLESFITGYRSTQLAPEEIIYSITIPRTGSNTQVYCFKVSKREMVDIATVSLSAMLRLSEDGIVEAVKLFYGGMAATVKRAAKTEATLTGKAWTEENIQLATALITEDFTPLSDARATANGRLLMARNLLLSLYEQSKNNSHGTGA